MKPRIPFLLYSYLATEMLAPFFASFVIMNCVFFLVKLIPFLNFVLDLEIGFSDFVRLFAYLFPNIFLYSIPMAAMMGVTIGFARLSSDSEILAIKASGISTYQLVPPVMVVVTLISLLTGYFSVKLIPLSEISMKKLTYQLFTEKIHKGIKAHTFTEALGDVVVYVDEIDHETGEWKDVWVSDMREVVNPTITMASTGNMTGRIDDMSITIVLRNGSLHRPGLASSQIVQFDNYQINIPISPGKSGAMHLKTTSLPLNELLIEADKLPGDTPNKRKIIIEYHKRLVLPVGCLVIGLIGLPLGLQARPGRKAVGIQAGLTIFVLYYIIFTLGKNLAEEGHLAIPIAMWGPNFFFALLTIYWVVKAANEKPLVPTFLIYIFRNLWRFLTYTFKLIYTPLMKAIGPPRSNNGTETASQSDFAVNTTITGDAQNKVFHLPVCHNYHCHHCTLEFKSIEIAVEAGFKPCPFCEGLIES